MYRKKLLLLVFIMIALLLCGCSVDNQIHFRKDLIIEYGSDRTPLHMIERIGNTEITDQMINDNVLECGNMKIVCKQTIDTEKLGKYDVTYETSDSNNRYITKTIQVADTVPPEISFKGLKQNVLEMELADFKNYNFSKNITVTDNYDEDPTVDVSVKEINSNKEYTVQVIATDCFDNVSKDEFVVKIKEEKKEKNENEGKTSSKQESERVDKKSSSSEKKESHSNKSKNDTSQKKNDSNSASSSTASSQKKGSQSFYFGEHYTLNGQDVECNMENVYQICSSRMSGNSECIPIQENGAYIGMKLNFY